MKRINIKSVNPLSFVSGLFSSPKIRTLEMEKAQLEEQNRLLTLRLNEEIGSKASLKRTADRDKKFAIEIMASIALASQRDELERKWTISDDALASQQNGAAATKMLNELRNVVVTTKSARTGRNRT